MESESAALPAKKNKKNTPFIFGASKRNNNFHIVGVQKFQGKR